MSTKKVSSCARWEALCLSSVWFALSQPYHLSATVGVPLTVHLHAVVGPDSSCRGCPFISILISSVGVAPAERLWSRPLLLRHHRQQHHLRDGGFLYAISATKLLRAETLLYKITQNKYNIMLHLSQQIMYVLPWIQTKIELECNFSMIRSFSTGIIHQLNVKWQEQTLKMPSRGPEHVNMSKFLLTF